MLLGTMGIDERIYHNGDADTYIQLLDDRLILAAGGHEAFDYDENGTSTLKIDDADAADITFHTTDLFIGGSEGSYDGNVGIGIAAPTQKLHVAGNMRLTGGFYDKDNSLGSAGQILTTNGSATYWSAAGSGTISGSGTDNYVPRFNGTSALAEFCHFL